MDYQQVHYFLQLSVDKSYPIAAEKLFITQQALRKSMKRLEGELGCPPLFYRAPKSLELTKVGACVKAHLLRIVDEAEKMNASLAKLSSKDTQLVRCASSLGIYSRLITRVVKPFRAKNASARITVQELDDKSCEQAVINGDADLGFCIGPNDSEYFDVYQIESHHLSAMVCKRNPLHTKSTLTLEDLGDYPLAIVNNRFKINSNFCKACKDRGISPNIEFQGGDVVSVHNFSRFENNIAITVDYLAKEICYPESVVTTLDVPELDWTINMVIAKHNNLTPAAASLALIVQEAFPC